MDLKLGNWLKSLSNRAMRVSFPFPPPEKITFPSSRKQGWSIKKNAANPPFMVFSLQRVYASSEKAMAPHSSTLAWRIPWMEEPGGLQSMGSQRVRHDWATSVLLFTFLHWRRKWQPTPVFLPGEFQGQGSLMGCSLWGCTESDTTEVT